MASEPEETSPPRPPASSFLNKVPVPLVTLVAVAVLVGLVFSGVLPPEVRIPGSQDGSTSSLTSTTVATTGLEGNLDLTILSDGVMVAGLLPDLAGVDGEVSVVAIGHDPSPFGAVPIVVVNQTSMTMERVRVAITIRDSDGVLAGSGESDWWVNPYRLSPGDLAIGRVFIDGTMPEQPTFEFTTSFSESRIDRDDPTSLRITEAAVSDGNLTARAVNITSLRVRSVTAGAVCFDKSGNASHYTENPGAPSAAGPGQSVVMTLSHGECSGVLITAWGHQDD